MKVELIHNARIRHFAGEVVEVSSAEYNFLISVGAAKPVAAKVEPKPAKKSAKK